MSTEAGRNRARICGPAAGSSPRGITRRWVGTGLALTMLLAACGSDTDTADPGTESPGAPAESPTGPDSPEGTEPEAGSDYDDDVIEVFETFVSTEMPGVTIDMVQAAKDEGTLTFLSPNDPSNNALVDGFLEVFGFIDIDHLQMTGGAGYERFTAEQSVGQVGPDVITTTIESAIMEFVDNGWCAEYVPSNESAYPDAAKVAGFTHAYAGGVQGIVFSPEDLGPDDVAVLATWDGLMDEHWSDGWTFGWVNIDSGGTHLYSNSFFYREYGTELWERHKEIAGPLQIFSAGNPAANAALRGEIQITAPNSAAFAYRLWEAGAPMGWVTPTPTLAVPMWGCVVENAGNPNVGRLFWDYALTSHGQQAMVPAMTVSYKDGFEAVYPDSLVAEEWFTPPDASQAYTMTAEEIDAIRDEVTSNWHAIIGQN